MPEHNPEFDPFREYVDSLPNGKGSSDTDKPSSPEGVSYDASAQFDPSHPKHPSHRRQAVRDQADDLLSRAPSVEPSPDREAIELDPKTIELMQKTYDFLGLNINIQQEYNNGNIILPTPEQKEKAKDLGYTFPLIIDGSLPRQDIIDKVTQTFAQEFNSQGVYLSNEVKTDIPNTQAAKTPIRPNQLYLIYLKPQKEVSEAHPDTINQNVAQCQAVLQKEQEDNPDINLKGLTLPEYLILQAAYYQQEIGKPSNPMPNPKEAAALIDSNHWSWLLEEVVNNPDGTPARCLDASWPPAVRDVCVGSGVVERASSRRGARFAALPAEASA